MRYIITEAQVDRLKMLSYIVDTIKSYKTTRFYYYTGLDNGKSWSGYGGDPKTEEQKLMVSKITAIEPFSEGEGNRILSLFSILLPRQMAEERGFDFDVNLDVFRPAILMRKDLYDRFSGFFGSSWKQPFIDWAKDYYNINEFGYMKYVKNIDIKIVPSTGGFLNA